MWLADRLADRRAREATLALMAEKFPQTALKDRHDALAQISHPDVIGALADVGAPVTGPTEPAPEAQIGALGNGAILTALGKVIDWFANPDNQAKIKAVALFIVQLIALIAPMFGIPA